MPMSDRPALVAADTATANAILASQRLFTSLWLLADIAGLPDPLGLCESPILVKNSHFS